jgi:DNA-binding response OmpR family regulator
LDILQHVIVRKIERNDIFLDDAGMDAYLVKPVRFQQLLPLMDELLGRKSTGGDRMVCCS